MRRPSTFKMTDITRAMKAVLQTGLSVARVEINRDGVIVVIPGKPVDTDAEHLEGNEWDSLT